MEYQSQRAWRLLFLAWEYILGLSRLAPSSGDGYNLSQRLVVDALSNRGSGGLCALELMEFSDMTRG